MLLLPLLLLILNDNNDDDNNNDDDAVTVAVAADMDDDYVDDDDDGDHSNNNNDNNNDTSNNDENIIFSIECTGTLEKPVASLVPEGILYRQTGAEVNLTCNVYFGFHYQDDILALLVWTRVTTWENGSVAEDDIWIPQYGSVSPIYIPEDPRLQLTLT